MAHTKSALKRVKTGGKARLRNKSRRNAIATVEKKFRAAIASDFATAENLLKDLYKMLDKAVKGGTLHRNAADRKKSRLAIAINVGKAKKA